MSNNKRQTMLYVDPARYEVAVKQGEKTLREMTLPTREFDVLRMLGEADGRVLTREQMRLALLGKGSTIDLRMIDQHVSRLRRRLGSMRNMVKTVNNRGYKADRSVRVISN